MLTKYKGYLGNFTYDTTQFTLYSFDSFDYLKYIGKETDGKKINIPYGIVAINSMFKDNNILQTLPVIPNTVKMCMSTFTKCTSLQEVDDLPDSITVAQRMFEGCSALQRVVKFPNHLKDGTLMFSRCSNLQEVPEFLPKTLNLAVRMFADCRNLTITPKFYPKVNIDKCNYMFKNCVKLRYIHDFVSIADSVVYYEGVYNGCTSLVDNACFKNRELLQNYVSNCLTYNVPVSVLDSAIYSLISYNDLFSHKRRKDLETVFKKDFLQKKGPVNE